MQVYYGTSGFFPVKMNKMQIKKCLLFKWWCIIFNKFHLLHILQINHRFMETHKRNEKRKIKILWPWTTPTFSLCEKWLNIFAFFGLRVTMNLYTINCTMLVGLSSEFWSKETVFTSYYVLFFSSNSNQTVIECNFLLICTIYRNIIVFNHCLF
jgi:hypothetical protein